VAKAIRVGEEFGVADTQAEAAAAIRDGEELDE
jgi:hypothetical protein